jgi:DNA adenine methylase
MTPAVQSAKALGKGRGVTPVALSRWTGAKRWLAATYPHWLPLPKPGGRAFDCTAGSCVVPFWYLRQGIRVVIGDVNPRLVGTLRNLQRRVRDVVAVLAEIAEAYRRAPDQRADFYERRQHLNRLDPADVGASALFLFVLRAGFNGLYRENQSGECNTTWGDKRECDVRADELHAISALLQRADIRLGDFEETSSDIRRGEALFADFPYVKRGAFTTYTKGGFTLADRLRGGVWLRHLDRRGVRWTATDAATDHALATYGLWHVERVDVRRSGSGKAKGRGSAQEVVAMNWLPIKKEAA